MRREGDVNFTGLVALFRLIRRNTVWLILKNTIEKVNTRVCQVQEKLQLARLELNTEAISNLEHVLAGLLKEQKQTFIMVFEQFVLALREVKGQDELFDRVESMMRETARQYHHQVCGMLVTLKSLVFQDDELTRDVVEQIRCLHV